jgi:hypothetical protein
MIDKWLGLKAHHSLHILGMSVLAFGLPMNKVLMSIGVIWGVSNLILEADFKTYHQRLKSNKIFLLILAIFLLHFVALIWSDNWSYGLDDIRKKLPFLAVPLALTARPIDRLKDVLLIIYAFLLSLAICSFINFGYYFNWWGNSNTFDYRSMSVFGSHIRFSLLIVIGICFCFYLFVQKPKLRFIWIILIFWFLIYTYFSQVMSGILAIVGSVYLGLVYLSWQKKLIRFSLLIFPLIALIILFGFTQKISQKNIPKVDILSLEHLSAEGHYYHHNPDNQAMVNGTFIYLYICDEELKREWVKRSKMDILGFDGREQLLKQTLYRYLASKNLRKDAIGMSKLTDEDIRNVETGKTSEIQNAVGFMGRLADIQFQIENREDPNGHSLLQRIEYWRTGVNIFFNHPIIGVGTGDVQDAFDQQYTADNSALVEQYRHRAHNTYLTFLITFGPIGLVLLMWLFYAFLKVNFAQKRWIAFLFLGVISFSFFVEDTIETQTGVCLFALFISLFIVPFSDNSDSRTKSISPH